MSAGAFLKNIFRGAAKNPVAAGNAAVRAAKAALRPHEVIHRSFKSLPKDVQRGYRSESVRRGFDSFAGAIPQYAAEKVLGTVKVRKAIHKYVNHPSLKADIAAGNVAADTAKHFIPDSWADKLFSIKDQVSMGKGVHKEVRRTSLIAPLSHTMEIAKPMAVAAAIDKAVRPQQEKAAMLQSLFMKKVAAVGGNSVSCKTGGKVMVNQQLREKVAHTMLHLHKQNKEHEKRAQATKLLYKQAELGFIELPRSFDEFQVKLASLMKEDLAVVEKAMEYTGGVMKLGELDSTDTSRSQNATEAFQAAIIGEHF